LLRGGVSVVNLNYDLSPDVTLTEPNRQITTGINHIEDQRAALGLGNGDLYLMGHSSGAHAAALAAADPNLARLISGTIAVSGVYDTRAVTRTSINEDVRMSRNEADALNVLAMSPQANIRILCSVGGNEPPAWIGQSIAYYRMANTTADDCRLDIVEGADHFGVLEASCDPDHAAGQRLLSFLAEH
jgi:arylformamidase